ncbi:unnamed protein product [Umbelopsis sp. WA50703]
MFRTTCRPLQAVFFSRASVKVAPKVNPISVDKDAYDLDIFQNCCPGFQFKDLGYGCYCYGSSTSVQEASLMSRYEVTRTITEIGQNQLNGIFMRIAFASPLREPLDPASSVKPEDRAVSKSLFHTGEITFGAFLGVCTGYLIKKVGKLFAMMVGVGFVFLQYCSSKGFVSVHWDRIENNWWKRGLDVDADGKVTKTDLKNKWNMVVGFLTQNLQFKSSFTAGLYAGIRYG